MVKIRSAPVQLTSQGGGANVPAMWRVTVFRVLAGLAGCLFVGTLPQAISPWGDVTLSNPQGISDATLHRWSAALAGGPDLGMAAMLLYLAWRPMQAQLVLQWLGLAAIVFLATNVPFVGAYIALIVAPIVLVLALCPEPRSLLVAPWADGVRLPVLAVWVVVAIFLLVDAARAMASQVGGTDELARNYDAASNAEHMINIGLAALLAGTRRPGALALALMAAAVLAFMGAAAVTVPANPASWGAIGGTAAVLGALALVATYRLPRNSGRLAIGRK